MAGQCSCDLLVWGSYDESKPRVRLLLGSLRHSGVLAGEINIPVWKGIRDKSVAGPGRLMKAAIRLLLAYPGALIRLLRQTATSAILLAYPAIPDVFLAWPIARLRRQRIVLDAFIPLHDTLVGDRGLIHREGIAAKLVWQIERAALRLADIIIVDTDQHGDFYSREFGIPRDRFQTILVGAEPAFWAARSESAASHPAIMSGRPLVLFYGQMIPLHGLDTVIEAIRLTASLPMHWLIIGSGQEEPMFRRFLDEYGGDNVSWIPWVDYEELPGFLVAASVALGIFGTSDKAARVIPNKMFQILAAGKAVVTRESSAVDPIAARYPDAVITVPAGDGAALADAVMKVVRESDKLGGVPREAETELGPAIGVQVLLNRLRKVH